MPVKILPFFFIFCSLFSFAQKEGNSDANKKMSSYWNSMERILFSELPSDTTIAIGCHQLDSAIFYFYDYIKIAKNELPPAVFKTKAVYYLLELQTRFRDIYLRNPDANFCYKAKNYAVLNTAMKLDPENIMVKNNLLLFNSEIQRLEHNKTIEILKGFERENHLQQDSLRQKADMLKAQLDEIFFQKKLLQAHETKLKSQKEELFLNETKINQQRTTLLAQLSKIQNQYLIISLSVVAVLLIALVLIIVTRSLRITRKQKQIIELQKNEVTRQKEIVDIHQKEVIDSINYAKRIQDALLKEQEHVSLHLPEHFIFFKPKDIVSGDFYWSFEKENYWYLAAADCTGHGVPGGFLTMLGTVFLNEINATHELLTPAEILNKLRARFIKELGQTGVYGNSNDGMDISLCRVEFNRTKDRHIGGVKLQWAGANSPIYLIRNSIFEEIKANKQPIGYVDKQEPFTNHLLELNKGDIIILSSDGYADQFNPQEKKLKKKVVKEILLSIQDQSLAEQKKYLEKFHNDWKGDAKQTDDICIVGVRI
jgi:serine phosphatase RsbU (regulator of sigma subunit)